MVVAYLQREEIALRTRPVAHIKVVRDFHQYRAGRKIIECLGYLQSAACVETGSSAMMGMLRAVIFNVRCLSATGTEHARAIRQ